MEKELKSPKKKNKIPTNSSLPIKEYLEMMDYNKRKTLYIKRKHNYSVSRNYDKKIVYLYKNGKLIIDKVTYPLDSLYITYNLQKNDYDLHLISTNSKIMDLLTKEENFSYDGVVKFIDTTAFIAFINTLDKIKSNNILVKDKENLGKIIKNWDGDLHQETSQTEAIKIKNVLKRKVKNEKTK